ncbi:MAG: ribonuclease PH [Gemmatimonadetes bacterium]|nr:MAG: ribonuclease PH [Gemmatimonadota bacterium]
MLVRRIDNRDFDELRDIAITRNYTMHAEGSVLVEFGRTHVLCTASVDRGVPKFLYGQNQGWLTAEYGMLPRSTEKRVRRERGNFYNNRAIEIQRLIGRALRSVIDLRLIKDYTITVDCDVIQADGGTRTAAITGAFVAMVDAVRHLQKKDSSLKKDPIQEYLAAISVGVIDHTPVLDLNYSEDSIADVDMNVVMTESGRLVELQGTAEKNPFTFDELHQMLAFAKTGIEQLIELQKDILK